MRKMEHTCIVRVQNINNEVNTPKEVILDALSRELRLPLHFPERAVATQP